MFNDRFQQKRVQQNFIMKVTSTLKRQFNCRFEVRDVFALL